MSLGALRLGRRVALVMIAVGLTAGLGVGLSSALAATGPSFRLGAAPRTPAGATNDGALQASRQLSILVTLNPRDPAGLADYASAVSTPGSSLYRHYLTVGQFRQQFAPTGAQLDAVLTSLRSHGLQPGAVSADGLIVPVSASAARVGAAFATSFEQVTLDSGRTAYANTRAPQFDASVAGLVQGVIGLDTLTQPHRLGIEFPHDVRAHALGAVPQVVTGGPQPCSAASSAGPANDSYTADQLASAYRFSGLYGAGDLGAGQTVALFELELNRTSDISAYQSCYGTSATVTYIKEDGGATGSGYGSGEAALDIEDVVGLAPKATVDVYQAPNSNTGLIDDYTAIVDNDTAKVVSTSWGDCESASGSTILSAENTLFEQAATQGQSIFAAAGDGGSSDCGTSAVAVDDPASQPYVTGVGGTTLSTLGPPPSQTVWNDSGNETGAGGGGISTAHPMPSYQSGAPASLGVINANSSGLPCGAASGSYCREVPDVSADADPYTGYVIYYRGRWSGIGGTSAAAPLWAAFTALANASSACNGTPVGFANPVLYTAAANAYSSDFSDITSGNNDYTPSGYTGGLYPSRTGFDEASGLGTPIGSTLAAAMCNGGAGTNTVTVTNPGSQSSTVGTAVSLQIAATDSASSQTLAYSATGLPAGLSINSSTGLITGTPTTAATYSVTVTATDTTGAEGTTSFTWTVSSSCAAAQLINNWSFEHGSTGWSASPGVIGQNGPAEPAHTGTYDAWLDGQSAAATDTLAQTVAIPSGCTSARLGFWLHIDTAETTKTQALDTLEVQLVNSSGTVLTTLATFSNLNAISGYGGHAYNVAAYAGQTVTLKFTGVQVSSLETSFVIDDVALNVS